MLVIRETLNSKLLRSISATSNNKPVIQKASNKKAITIICISFFYIQNS